MANIGGSIGLSCLVYGLLAGAAFFIYLCLFTHVRDTVTDAKWRGRYYFLIAVTFVLIGRYAGISVVFGVLPMLAVLYFLPRPRERKGPFAAIVGCSLAFAVLSGCVMFFLAVTAASKAIDDTEAAKQVASAAPAFDPDKYFVSDAIDPNMEFEEPVEVTVGDMSFKLPIPKNCSYTINNGQTENAAAKMFLFSDPKGFRMLAGFQKDVPGDNKNVTDVFEKEKKAIIHNITMVPFLYIEQFSAQNIKSGFVIKNIVGPELVQNTNDSIVVFSYLDCEKYQAKQSFGYLDATLMIGGRYFSFVLVLRNESAKDDQVFGMTWIHKLR